MQNKIANLQTKYSAVAQACLACKVAYRTGTILAPAGLAGYLGLKYDDPIVLLIASAAGLYSLVRIVNSAYLAEAGRKKPRRK